MIVALKGKYLKRYTDRIYRRQLRHNNWRQVYVDCLGMCQYPLDDGGVCGEVDTLEFHEIYGEAKNGESRLQQRVLICNHHHWLIHGKAWVNVRHYSSMLQFDVELEIKACGGYKNWLKEFNLIERSVKYDIKNDNRQDTTDFNYSSDS